MRAPAIVLPVARIALVMAACSKDDATLPAPAPGPPPPPPAACDIDGTYHMRYRSNSSDGWWFHLQVAHGKASLIQPADMLELPKGPIGLAATGCKLTLTSKSEHAGDVRVELALDPKTNKIGGTLTRSKKTADDDSPVAIGGVREHGALPTCLHSGSFEIAVEPKTRWKQDGVPLGPANCKLLGDAPIEYVRIQPLGDELVIDPLDGSRNQTFERARVTRSGDCELDVATQAEDKRVLHAHLTLNGDVITGEASVAQFPILDPQSGRPPRDLHRRARQGDRQASGRLSRA